MWQAAIGPLATLAVILVFHLLSLSPFGVPGTGAILVTVVLFSAYASGLIPGLVSAAMAVADVLFTHSEPGAFLIYSPRTQERMLVLALVIPASALMVGLLKRRLERETRARIEMKALELTHDLIQNIDAIVWEVDTRTGRLTFVSRRAEEILGYPADRWLNDPDFWRVGLHPDDMERVVSHCRESLTVGRDIDLEHRARAADGRTVWLRDVVRVTRDPDGHPTRLRGVALDVTARKQAEEAARRSESELHAVFDAALDAIVILDDRGTLMDANPAACALLELPHDQIVGRHLLGFVASGQDLQGLWRLFLQQGEMFGEMCLVLAGGAQKEVDYTARANFLPGRHISILRDVTRRRKIEEQLRSSQKLEAIGKVAGHVAHDLKNLLTVISGHCELLQEHCGPDQTASVEIEEVLKAAGRASEMTHGLLAFSRKQALEPRPLDLNAEIAAMEPLLRQVLGEKIRLDLLREDRLPLIHADHEGVRQLIANLVTNARDAMPGGGTLAIETARTEDPQAEMGAWVSLVVRDTGHGIDRETRARIFEPFFTTKAASGGTGLGLSAVYGFVMQSGGRIFVESEPGKGAAFRVHLRPAAEEARAGETADNAASARAAPATILVVDDEEAVLKVASVSLERHGYKVLRAVHPDDALRLSAEHTGPIDLLLTDLVMPGMSGPDLASALAHGRAEMKILFMSGFDREALGRPEAPDRAAPFLAKPFSPRTLVQKVSRVLRGKVESEEASRLTAG